MTIETLEKQLKPLESSFDNGLLRWLYLHLPPQPIKSKKAHRDYLKAVGILMSAHDDLGPEERAAIEKYVSVVAPLVESYERKTHPIPEATPEEILTFLMDQHKLTQYDLADDLGGQPVVSDVLRGKRKLSRDQIERLSKRFSVSPATFYSKAANA